MQTYLTLSDRQALRMACRDHPNISDLIYLPESIKSIDVPQLIDLAQTLEIDIEDAIRAHQATHQNHDPAPDYEAVHHPFNGALEFTLSTTILGRTTHSRLIVEYEYTPSWPFYDGIGSEDITADASLVIETFIEHSAEAPGGTKASYPSATCINDHIGKAVHVPSLAIALGDDFLATLQDEINHEAVNEDAVRQNMIIQLTKPRGAHEHGQSETSR